MHNNTTARFQSKAAAPNQNGCLIWTGGRNNNGYGLFWTGGRMILAHRFAWELANGPIPDGLEIDHLCRNRACQNVAHMEPVTHTENVIRGEAGDTHNASKTRCPAGHLYSGDNLYTDSIGKRHCCTCRRAYWHRRGHDLRQAQGTRSAVQSVIDSDGRPL